MCSELDSHSQFLMPNKRGGHKWRVGKGRGCPLERRGWRSCHLVRPYVWVACVYVGMCVCVCVCEVITSIYQPFQVLPPPHTLPSTDTHTHKYHCPPHPRTTIHTPISPSLHFPPSTHSKTHPSHTPHTFEIIHPRLLQHPIPDFHLLPQCVRQLV